MANDWSKTRTKWVLRMRLDLDLGPRYVLVERAFRDGNPLMAVLPAKAQFPVWDETFGSLEELELRCAAEGIPWEDVDASSVSGGRWRELLP